MMRLDLAPAGAPAIRGRVACALAELGARIWEELEGLAQHAEQRTASAMTLHAATLRLELLIILDAGDSLEWRSRLTSLERATLRSMVLEVLHIIAVKAEVLTRSVIEQAQDRIFDQVLEQSSCAEAATSAAQIHTTFPRERRMWVDGAGVSRRDAAERPHAWDQAMAPQDRVANRGFAGEGEA